MNPLLRPLAPFVSGATYRALLYHLAAAVLGSLGLALVIAGWACTLCFAITPLVVPILIGFRLGVGTLARVEAAMARELLSVDVRPRVRTEGRGFWGRGFAVLRDEACWRQQAHLLVAWLLGIVAIAPFSLGVQSLAIPLYWDSAGDPDVFGIPVDTLGEAFLLGVPVGLALIVVGVYLVGPLTKLSRRLARSLLAGEGERIVRSPAELSARRLRALSIVSLISTSVVLALIAIWWLTTPEGYFWPIWPLLSLSIVVGMTGCIVLVRERPELVRLTLGSQALAIQIGSSVVLVGFLTGVWAVTTNGYFWPIWPALGLALLAGLTAAGVYGQREHRIRRLEETRAGAVDAQESELRRIERDLHDGAQARLVALGMNLGMAEQRLETDPEGVRQLLAEARRGAGEALEELRDLARGIHPPILTDRGLEAAVGALTSRSPWPVAVAVDVPARPPAAVETAAYFVVSEALANVSKHAQASRVGVLLQSRDGVLIAEVVDNGRGGADASGSGLTGLRQRVEALDGTLSVTSPVGGPTTVRAELPCES
jgi:signal transduction histidine kinase